LALIREIKMLALIKAGGTENCLDWRLAQENDNWSLSTTLETLHIKPSY
jgi:hypothetical protein